MLDARAAVNLIQLKPRPSSRIGFSHFKEIFTRFPPRCICVYLNCEYVCVLVRCYNPCMNPQKRLAQLKLEFLKRLQDLPHDISVPNYERWDGPGPIPMVDYVVEYEADAGSILGRVLSADQGLGLLQRRLDLRLAEKSHVLVVSLSGVAELSAF